MIGKSHSVALLSGWLCLLSHSAIATIYTWVDEKGVTHYSQTKPTEVNVAEEIKVKQTNAFTFEDDKKYIAAVKSKDDAKKAIKAKEAQRKADDCWRQGNSLGFLIAAADGLYGKEKDDYVKMVSDKKRALEKVCGKNSNAWDN